MKKVLLCSICSLSFLININLYTQSFTEIPSSLVGVWGNTIACGDYDKDGDMDLLVVGLTDTGAVSKVYRNDNGIFVDINAPLVGVFGQYPAAWVDYDADGDLDIFLSGATAWEYKNPVTKIYRNDNGVFTEIPTNLPTLVGTLNAWSDYDKDGDPDLLFTGSTNGGPPYFSIILRNDGGGNFTNINAGLVNVWCGAVSWCDYDKDGDDDVFIAGWDGSSTHSKIYKNNNGIFVDIHAPLTSIILGSSSWGDFDNDGDKDLLLTGFSDGWNSFATIYRNDNGTFVDISPSLNPVGESSSAWGDFDNDGDLDILINGHKSDGSLMSTIYRNTNGQFSNFNPPFTGLRNGTVNWIDYDNDGDLDVVISGISRNELPYTPLTKIYRNNLGPYIGSISGIKFEDKNGNGGRDIEDPGISNWKIKLFQNDMQIDSIITTENGDYLFNIASPGTYIVREELLPRWMPTVPVQWEYTDLHVDSNTNIVGKNFGNFKLGIVSGQKFKDNNKNGEKDISERGIKGWKLILKGTRDDSTLTDENGYFIFYDLPIGNYTISEESKQGWEQTYPLGTGVHDIVISSSGQVINDVNFGNVISVPKIKMTLSYYNSDKSALRNIYWGIKSGAGYGIWGVDPGTTNIDSAEGESELPPPVTGTFDARFINPDHSPNYFGNGSWTDVRNFVGSTQSDTFKISFQPGPMGYPVTFKWSKDLIIQSFGGIVKIGKNPGNWVDMKLVDSLVVTNVNTSTLYIISSNPSIPILYNKGWNIVSLPMIVEDARRTILFPVAVSNLYKYDHVLGYLTCDTLEVGNGYWIKFPGVIPPMVLEGNEINSYIVNVFNGWNLIGSITNPISVNSIVSDPSGIIAGGFFGYDGSYYSADTLKPFMGYWVKVNQNGQLILSSPLK